MKIGQLTVERDFFSQKIRAMSAARLSLVDRADQVLSIVAHCRLLKVARSSLYYRLAPVSKDDLAVMRRRDELSTGHGGWWRYCGARAGR
jgi:hypothetical protein